MRLVVKKKLRLYTSLDLLINTVIHDDNLHIDLKMRHNDCVLSVLAGHRYQIEILP